MLFRSLACKAMGVSKIIVSDALENRLALALQHGADYAIFTNITEEGMVYVAEYNENGTLLSIKSDEISDSVIIPFTCVNKSKVKVFIWKNDMKPLFNKVFTLN